jgi:uncharacterized membrane protein
MGREEDTVQEQYHGVHDSFHEASRHGYVRVYLYFFLFGLIAALLGVWAMLQNDTTSIPAAIARTNWPTPPDPTKLQTCNDMNKFHALFSILCFAQAAVMFGLALMLWKFNGCCCWIFTIVFVIGYTFIMLAETAVLVMAILWTWNNAASSYCLQYVPSFYNNSLIFLEVTCGVLGFQALFGTFFVIYYGLCTATREAGSHLVTRDADDREPLVVHH